MYNWYQNVLSEVVLKKCMSVKRIGVMGSNVETDLKRDEQNELRIFSFFFSKV